MEGGTWDLAVLGCKASAVGDAGSPSLGRLFPLSVSSVTGPRAINLAR